LVPPLPDIKSPNIERQVFTHRSLHARPTHVFEDRSDDPSPDNEKYEHLGDTVLGLVVTSLMLEMYPGLRVGPSTKIRALIVGMQLWPKCESLRYKLPDRLRLHSAQAVTLRASTNIQADVFESFVGGLYVDQGLDAVKTWLDLLFRPYARAAYIVVRKQHGLPALPTPSASPRSPPSTPLDKDEIPSTTIGHLALFNQHLQKADRAVEWIYSDRAPLHGTWGTGTDAIARGTMTTPMWYVKVMVDGEFFGQGRGGTKKAARNEAAKEGLKKLGIHVW
ncbi:ribonuclease III domain-containing protein, partial [Infundibulicybe gibba]